MRLRGLWLVFCVLGGSRAKQELLRETLVVAENDGHEGHITGSKKLHGRFLHITGKWF